MPPPSQDAPAGSARGGGSSRLGCGSPDPPGPSRRSGPVTLLVLLARAAPARVVPADSLLVVLDDRLLIGDRSAAVAGLIFEGLLGGDVSAGGRRDGRLAERRGLLGGATRVVETADLLRRRELRLRLRSHLDLDMEDQARELLPDRVHKRLEHREALVLVGDQRIDLREAAEVDALAEVVHLVEVLAPAVVDDLQQDRPLELAHDLVAEVLFAAVVGGERIGEQLLPERLTVDVL